MILKTIDRERHLKDILTPILFLTLKVLCPNLWWSLKTFDSSDKLKGLTYNLWEKKHHYLSRETETVQIFNVSSKVGSDLNFKASGSKVFKTTTTSINHSKQKKLVNWRVSLLNKADFQIWQMCKVWLDSHLLTSKIWVSLQAESIHLGPCEVLN